MNYPLFIIVILGCLFVFIMNMNSEPTDEIKLLKQESLINELELLHKQFKTYSNEMSKRNYSNCKDLLDKQEILLNQINIKTEQLKNKV